MNNFSTLLDRKGFSFERIISFIEVAQQGSISKAAPKDIVRQSLISRQLKELEHYVGSPLFVRSKNKFKLTTAGESLYQESYSFLENMHRLRGQQTNNAITLTIADTSGITEDLFIAHYKEIRKIFGNVIIDVYTLPTYNVLEGLEKMEIDFGFTREITASKIIQKELIGSAGYSAVFPRKLLKTFNIKPKKEEILKQLHKIPWVGFRSDTRWMESLILQLNPHIVPVKLIQCGNFSGVKEALFTEEVAGLAHTVCLKHFPDKDFFTIPLPLNQQRTMNLLWNSKLAKIKNISSSQLKNLAKLLKKLYSS